MRTPQRLLLNIFELRFRHFRRGNTAAALFRRLWRQFNPERRHVRREEKISEGGFLRKEIFIPIRFSARAALQRKKICSPDESLLQLTFIGRLSKSFFDSLKRPGTKVPGRFAAYLFRYSSGSTASPSLVTEKCRWGPWALSAAAVVPTAPMTCPAVTVSPCSTAGVAWRQA